MKDALGNEVEVGQRCAYSRIARNVTSLLLGTIVDVEDNTVAIKADKSGRIVFRHSTEMVVKC